MNDSLLNIDQLSLWWQQAREVGDHAFSCIYRELFNGLYNYSLKLLQDGDLAKDAVPMISFRRGTMRRVIMIA